MKKKVISILIILLAPFISVIVEHYVFGFLASLTKNMWYHEHTTLKIILIYISIILATHLINKDYK